MKPAGETFVDRLRKLTALSADRISDWQRNSVKRISAIKALACGFKTHRVAQGRNPDRRIAAPHGKAALSLTEKLHG